MVVITLFTRIVVLGLSKSFAKMQKEALEDVAEISLYTPFLNIDKAEIARQSAQYNVPVENTWSCYKGNELQCGRCGTCVERIEAFHLAGIEDPTEYEDSEYWKTVA